MGGRLPLPGRSGLLSLLTAVAAAACLCGTEGKVYYSCGAQFNSMERGLILSPGFPNNYSSGMHCVWQFFIPARTYLLLEIFDFDVFENISENSNAWDSFLSFPKTTHKEFFSSEENKDLSTIFPTKSSLLPESRSKDFYNLPNGFPEATSQKRQPKQFQQIEEPKELAVTQSNELLFMGATNVTLPRQIVGGIQEENKDPKNKILLAHLTARGRSKGSESYKQHLGDVAFGENVAISTRALPTDTTSVPQSSADVCPHDVLYVSDLIAFSSRFCGANSPLNKNMTFGSSLKMVEVIVELITTTDRGRGFAMLFEYKNDTEIMAMDDSREGKESIMMLVIITGILFFALVLLSSLCIACRQKLCPKRSSLDAHSDQENGIQNAAVDLNELRLVMPSQENENNNHSVGGNGAATSCDGSMECSPLQTDPEVPSSMSAVTTDSGSDEVFIISASSGAGGLSFTSYRIQDKKLKRSITSPGSVSEYLAADQTESGTNDTEKGVAQTDSYCPTQPTWKARTFHDLLFPLPQLQKRWCSWTTSGPFIKLVNSSGFSTSVRNQSAVTRKVTSAAEIEGASELAYPDSSASSASYPLTHLAQKQRKLSGSCNLKRARFGNPYFGFLTSSPDSNCPRLLDHSKHGNVGSPVSSPVKDPFEGPVQLKGNSTNGSKTQELSLERDPPKPILVISEEGDDQLPLVLAEHMNQCVDVLSEPSVAIRNLGMELADEQPVGSVVPGEGLAEPTSIRVDLDLWGEYPSSHQDPSKGFSAHKTQSYVPDAETDTTTAHQNFDSLAPSRVCQTSVQ
ncbi:CUB and sushi domain-containing protein 2 [Varanus komodoensis]|nr:CUB and sushi domain-containing protein 2 [Varanus komodoensis]